MKKLIERLLWLPLLVLPLALFVGACEVDRSHVTEVEVIDTTFVITERVDTVFVPDTVFIEVVDTVFQLDTIFQTDTLFITDTVEAIIYDTVTVFDTVFVEIVDTVYVEVFDTVTLFDTVFVYDTIYQVDTLAIFELYCERRGHSNNWKCEYP